MGYAGKQLPCFSGLSLGVDLKMNEDVGASEKKPSALIDVKIDEEGSQISEDVGVEEEDRDKRAVTSDAARIRTELWMEAIRCGVSFMQELNREQFDNIR